MFTYSSMCWTDPCFLAEWFKAEVEPFYCCISNTNNSTAIWLIFIANSDNLNMNIKEDINLIHSKMRSPVKSNSTVGITLVMNLRKINSAKWESTFCPFYLIASDIDFSTLACLHGWTVGIKVFYMNGNFSIVSVLSKYYFWMSCLMSSLAIGFPLKSVALKNILGVW